ncbi:hypothetical protein ACLOJK_032285 [Asimina triloba]
MDGAGKGYSDRERFGGMETHGLSSQENQDFPYLEANRRYGSPYWGKLFANHQAACDHVP